MRQGQVQAKGRAALAIRPRRHNDAPDPKGRGRPGGAVEKQLSAIGSKIVQAYGHPIRAGELMILGARVAGPKEIAEELSEPIGSATTYANCRPRA